MKILFRILQWTWGFPQTLLGFLLTRIHQHNPQRDYHGCRVIFWNSTTNLSLGMYLLVSQFHYVEDSQLLVHAFGHSVQSLILGPLYLPLIALPSVLWDVLPQAIAFREAKNIPYCALYTEKSANFLGALVTKESCDLM